VAGLAAQHEAASMRHLTTPDLAALFESLADAELKRVIGSGELTDEAQLLAQAAAAKRGLELPTPPPEDAERQAADQAGEYQGDMTMVARYLTPTEAHLLCSCLHAAGVPAEAGDTHLVQAHSLLTGAVGGANVRVPANFVAEALEIIAAFKRGDFALDDDFNPGDKAQTP
jgi:hypothetical protein